MESDGQTPAQPIATSDLVEVEVEVKGLILDPSTNNPIVILRDEETERFLPIWIGEFEAQAIALALEDIESPRPMSHDLMATLVEELGGEVERILISNLDEGTFYAKLFVRHSAGVAIVDARPSDALALAVRLEAPIFVREQVFVGARDADLSSQLSDKEKLRKWLEDIDPDELGKYTM